MFKKAMYIAPILAAFAISAQDKVPAPAAPTTTSPEIDTATRVAMQSIEGTKNSAAQAFAQAQQQELTVLREWANEHQGWHIDMDAFSRGTFAVAKDTPVQAQVPAPVSTPAPVKNK